MKNKKETITVKVTRKKRVMWTINPVTRKPTNPRAYDRNKAKRAFRKEVNCNV